MPVHSYQIEGWGPRGVGEQQTAGQKHGARVLLFTCEGCGGPALYGLDCHVLEAWDGGASARAGTWWCGVDAERRPCCVRGRASDLPALVRFLEGAPLAYGGFDGIARCAVYDRRDGSLVITAAASGTEEARYATSEGQAVIFWLTNEPRITGAPAIGHTIGPARDVAIALPDTIAAAAERPVPAVSPDVAAGQGSLF